MNSRFYQTNFYHQYDQLQDFESRLQKAKKIVSFISIFRKDYQSLRCLDIGCSSGFITSALQPYFYQMVGLDYDPSGLLAVPKQNKEHTLFIRGDALTLPFSDDSFDAIICTQVYEHVPDDQVLFSELSRIIRSNGIIFFSGPNKLFPIEPHYKIPFIHWLPLSWADWFIRIIHKGSLFDIRSRTYHDLRKIFINFDVFDMTLPLLKTLKDRNRNFGSFLLGILLKLPKSVWRQFLLPFTPNINWVLLIPNASHQEGSYNVLA